VAVTTGAVWVSDPARATLWRIDPERNQVVGSVPADGWELAVGSDQTVWATSGNRLLGLDRRALRRTLTLGQLGSNRINAVTAGPDALWVAAPTGLFRVDLVAPPPRARASGARWCSSRRLGAERSPQPPACRPWPEAFGLGGEPGRIQVRRRGRPATPARVLKEATHRVRGLGLPGDRVADDRSA
jgi:hypothetical protein